jgi:hypothetical protein
MIPYCPKEEAVDFILSGDADGIPTPCADKLCG